MQAFPMTWIFINLNFRLCCFDINLDNLFWKIHPSAASDKHLCFTSLYFHNIIIIIGYMTFDSNISLLLFNFSEHILGLFLCIPWFIYVLLKKCHALLCFLMYQRTWRIECRTWPKGFFIRISLSLRSHLHCLVI